MMGFADLELSEAGLGGLAAPLRRLAGEFAPAVGPGAAASLLRLSRARAVSGCEGRRFDCTVSGVRAVLDLSTSAGAALLERVLAGDATWVVPARLTDLGAHMVEPLLQEWLAKGLGQEVRVGPGTDRPPDGDWLTVEMAVEIDGVGGDCVLSLPQAAWPPVAPVRSIARMPPWLSRRSLPVEAVVGLAHLTFEELRELRAGDLVPLDLEPGEPWKLHAARELLAGAHPCATDDGLLALLITDLEEQFLCP